MSAEHLHIDEESGSREGIRVFRLDGPLVLANLPNFQSKLRADSSQALILDFTAVPYIDSAAIGALVGAYVNRQKEGRRLGLVGVNSRIRQAFEVTRIESLLQFYDSIVEAERAVALRIGINESKRKAACRPPLSNFVSGLSGLNVFRLPALRSLYYIELDLLAFLQAAKAV